MMRLECGDCNELLKTVPDKSIDLIMTDPPYLFNSTTGGGSSEQKGILMESRNSMREYPTKHWTRS